MGIVFPSLLYHPLINHSPLALHPTLPTTRFLQLYHSPSAPQQLSGIPENHTFGGPSSDGATGEVRRLLAETELLLQDAQAADDRSKFMG